MNTKELLSELMCHIPVASIVQNTELTDLWQACNEAIAQPAATYESERAAMIAKYGDCCGGGDPMCYGGCLVQKAIAKCELSQPSAPVVPEGWKLVPIEPTEEMLAATDDLELTVGGGYGGYLCVDDAREIFKLMIADAPTPPTEPQRDESAASRSKP